MLNIDDSVLIITGCISPSNNVHQLVIMDSKIRYTQYIESIYWFLDNSNFKKIVFCDNSECSAVSEVILYANERGKQFEWLSFRGNSEKVHKCGKGYGEGEIIEYALDNSEIIKSVSYICKVTGRLSVENINTFIKRAHMEEVYFFTTMANRLGQTAHAIDTRFYGMPKEVYSKYYKSVYLNTYDEKGEYLEKVFFKAFCDTPVEASRILFFPKFCGKSGSMGVLYNESIIKIFLKSFASAKGTYLPIR